ncbi:ribosomal protection-like ABC-F family protein [Hydrogenoanaerobacterium sp.]|uniref:ribosomal protection-like ABC-F family protein n=1 Tax=Hydrogenoanaerobacterium sp. TaxID=2953763 RepID=UPI00289DDEF5|nr:ABC-F type ribosomal protection protein [Hydrogenoanaerobacterium sp.]
MSQINANNLSFSYDSSYDPIFENVSFTIDTDWKLGFIGRNGRGKTTLLNLLLGRYSYSGSITAPVSFDYFPFEVEDTAQNTIDVMKSSIAPYAEWEQEMQRLLALQTEEALLAYGDLLEHYIAADGYTIDSLIEQELGKLGMNGEVLSRPFDTLSNGERTRVLLAALFLKHGNFLLIDEPTNHLDAQGREAVANYLAAKKGFILVSHDRDLLDRVADHILSINRTNIEVQRGNYTSWQQNKDRQDAFELAENDRLKKEVSKLTAAAKQKAGWSDRLESTKIGHRPPDQVPPDRGFIGHKSAKMMKRAKVIEQHAQRALEGKSALLKNLEHADSLKLSPLPYRSTRQVQAVNLSIHYGDQPLFDHLNFTVEAGERVALCGGNGCGKSSILKLLLGDNIPSTGQLLHSGDLIISYVAQDTSFLQGDLKTFAQHEQVDESLFKTILRKLDFSRVQFEKDMSEFSGGQKKKVLLAKSLCQQAHLYVWDEPLNFIDILSRVQIEQLILEFSPTMLFVEHDKRFVENIATKKVVIGG